MDKKKWIKKITQACNDAGTYQPYFDIIIEELAAILEKRDEAEECYVKSGGQPVIEYTNRGGLTNPTKNPALLLWDNFNKTALAYWRDLGLTPAGLRKLKEDGAVVKETKPTTFSDIVSQICE